MPCVLRHRRCVCDAAVTGTDDGAGCDGSEWDECSGCVQLPPHGRTDGDAVGGGRCWERGTQHDADVDGGLTDPVHAVAERDGCGSVVRQQS